MVEQRSIRLSVNPQPLTQLHLLSIPQSRYLGEVRITVLSGAGISAESGVPTFRDDKNGLWAKFDPYELSSVQGWQRNPERVWGWYLWRHYLVGTVEPNDGHRAVAAWQDHAEVSVVTQNVDDLHERAGSSPVHHLHGSLFDFRCATCGMPYSGVLPEMTEPALEVEPPSCDCGGLIRPDIVWFGEALPEEPWQHAVEAASTADVLVVVGTSSIVYPAASLPELALSRGVVVVEVNPEPTPLSDSATITRARIGQHGPADAAAAAARAAELGRPPSPAQDELRHRQRHPGRQWLLGSGAVDVESRGPDGLLGVAMSVAVSRQPRP